MISVTCVLYRKCTDSQLTLFFPDFCHKANNPEDILEFDVLPLYPGWVLLKFAVGQTH